MWTFFLDSNFLIAIFSVDVFVFLPSSRFWWTNLRRDHQSPGDDCFHVNSCRNPTADFRRSIDYQHLLLVLNIWGRNNVHPHLSPSHTLTGFLSNRWGISHNFRLCQLRCAQTSQIYTYRISFVIESVLKYTSQFPIHLNKISNFLKIHRLYVLSLVMQSVLLARSCIHLCFFSIKGWYRSSWYLRSLKVSFLQHFCP